VLLYVNGEVHLELRLKVKDGVINFSSLPFQFGLPPPSPPALPTAVGFTGKMAEVLYYPFAQIPDRSALSKHPAFGSVSAAPFAPPSPPLDFVGAVLRLKAQDESANWNSDKDTQLLQLFGEISAKFARVAPRSDALDGGEPVDLLKLFAFDPLVSMLATSLRPTYPLLSGLSLAALLARFASLQSVNRLVVAALPLVDFSRASARFSLAHRLSSLRAIIFQTPKQLLWRRVLASSGLSEGNAPVTINRPRALKAMERMPIDLLKTAFGQLYQHLHFLRPSQLRVVASSRPWHVTYAGEGGVDVGGLFRDSCSHVCSELQMPHIPLLLPVPNHAAGNGRNQDKFVPNPACTSSLHLSMYAFIGKLMGMACRGGFVLNLDLPAAVWKPLVGQPVTAVDIHDIDVLCGLLPETKIVSDPVDAPSKLDDEKYPNSRYVKSFVVCNAVGQEVELKAGGKDIAVTADNYAEFIELKTAFRTHEFDAQVAAIRKGLSAIVPVQLLSLFTWQELEIMICGKCEIDIDFLKKNTKYRPGLSENDQHVQFMWQMLKDFTHPQRQLFLRFVWGQSRLPASAAQFTQKFEIMGVVNAANNPDSALPVSHTCFFSLELPRYSSLEIMKQRFIYAIYNCHAIDTDQDRVGNVDWDA